MLEKYTLLKWNVPRPLLHIYSIFLLLVGWGLFYFDDFGRLGQFFHAFFGMGEPLGMPMEVESLIFDNFWIWVSAIILCLPVHSLVTRRLEKITVMPGNSGVAYAHQLSRAVVSAAILAITVSLLIGATNNAFIYTRF